MIRSKREWRCTNCSKSQIKWSGVCIACKETGTMQEFVLIPTKKTTPTQTQRAIIRRAKQTERDIAKAMVAVDGADESFARLTKNGRIGQYTELRVDAVSKHYVIEAKNRVIPSWITKAWMVLSQRAHEWDKNQVLYLDPPNLPKEYPLNGTTYPMETMHVITGSRHGILIRKEKDLEQIEEIISSAENAATKLRKLREIFGV